MINATTAKSKTKKDARKTCTVCKSRFTPDHRSILTCSEDCKRTRRNKSAKATAQKTRTPKPFPMDNGFVRLLVRHAKEANTVQIFQGLSVSDLLELHQMYKTQLGVNAWTAEAFGTHHFSHVYPVKGQHHIGKFVPKNLVIANATLNRKHGTKYLGGGDFIRTADFDLRWTIDSGITDAAIVHLILDCIGRVVWDAFNKTAKLAPSRTQACIDKLNALLDRTNPDHADWLKVLDNPATSPRALSALLEAVTGKQPFILPTKWLTPMEVLISETKRLSAYRPELAPVTVALEQIEQAAKYFNHNNSFALGDDESYVFNILHGREVNADVLANMVADALSAITDSEDFSPKVWSAPIDFYTPEQLAEYHARIGA